MVAMGAVCVLAAAYWWIGAALFVLLAVMLVFFAAYFGDPWEAGCGCRDRGGHDSTQLLGFAASLAPESAVFDYKMPQQPSSSGPCSAELPR